MIITSALEYAYRAAVVLADAQGGTRPITSAEIASAQGLSEGFLLQILGLLRRAGIVDSIRGKRGGYRLSRPARQITLAELVSAVEGRKLQSECPVQPSAQCDRKSLGCGLLTAIDEANRAAVEKLATFDLESLRMADLATGGDMYAI